MAGTAVQRASARTAVLARPAPSEGLAMRLLGPPQITLNGTPLGIRRRKAEALLIFLAVMGGPQPREVLARLLAGSTTDDVARKHLRTALFELSDQIGPYLLTTRHSIALHRDLRFWLDVEQFTAMVEDTDPAVLERAVALYEDGFLSGFTLRDAPRFEAWALQEQEHLRELLVRALQRLLDQAIQAGDIARAIALAQRLLEVEPWCEETRRQLMWLFARTGRRSEALDQYTTCRRIIAENLSSEPQPETEALYERLRACPAPIPHDLPATTSSLIGRETELATLLQHLEDPACRLVTLVGLGGSGKSHLALEAAHTIAAAEIAAEQRFGDGIYLVDLAALRPPNMAQRAGVVAANSLMKAIGRRLGVHFSASTDAAAQLLAYLRGRSLLLILDNIEQLRAGAAVLSTALQQAPGITLLVTSRAPLGLAEEHVLTLAGLALPTSADDLEEAAASRLFLERAQHVRMNKPLSPTDRASVLSICRRVQGLPLALILAANWLSGLSCAGIAAELESGVDLLMATDHTAPERQRSLRAILDLLWDDLAESEREGLRQLAVFRGAFTTEAAEAVAGVSASMLEALASRLLLHCDEHGYTMHELVRLYAAERLADQPEEQARVEAWHASYYAGLARQYAPTVGRALRARVALGENIENLWVAWDWAVAHCEIDLLEQMRTSLVQWHRQSDLLSKWIAAVDRATVQVRAALAGEDTPNVVRQRLLAYLLFCRGEAFIWCGHDGPARELLEEARTVARATGLLWLEAHTAYYRAWLLRRGGKADARGPAEQALAMARVAQARSLEAYSLWLLGACNVDLGAYPQARAYLERAYSSFAAMEDDLGATAVSFQQAIVSYEQGDFATARSRVEEGLRYVRLQGDRRAEQLALHYAGLLCDAERGRHLEAEDYLARARALAQQFGDMHLESMVRLDQGQNALLQGDFERARVAYEQALRHCQETGNEALMARVLRGLGMLAHYLGNGWRAQELAQRALSIARETGQRRAERFAQRLLGHALLASGQLTEATLAYQQVLELDQLLGYSHLALEAGADLAAVAAARGDLDEAVARVAPLLMHLEGDALPGTEEPVQVYLTCYQVLKAVGDPRADAVLHAGYSVLNRRAAQFPDVERRSRFLENLPAHREITRLAAALAEPGLAATPETRALACSTA